MTWLFLVESALGILFVASGVALFLLDLRDRRQRAPRKVTQRVRIAFVVLGVLYLVALVLRFAGVG